MNKYTTNKTLVGLFLQIASKENMNSIEDVRRNVSYVVRTMLANLRELAILFNDIPLEDRDKSSYPKLIPKENKLNLTHVAKKNIFRN